MRVLALIEDAQFSPEFWLVRLMEYFDDLSTDIRAPLCDRGAGKIGYDDFQNLLKTYARLIIRWEEILMILGDTS
jgi:hypothetical protein